MSTNECCFVRVVKEVALRPTADKARGFDPLKQQIFLFFFPCFFFKAYTYSLHTRTNNPSTLTLGLRDNSTTRQLLDNATIHQDSDSTSPHLALPHFEPCHGFDSQLLKANQLPIPKNSEKTRRADSKMQDARCKMEDT